MRKAAAKECSTREDAARWKPSKGVLKGPKMMAISSRAKGAHRYGRKQILHWVLTEGISKRQILRKAGIQAKPWPAFVDGPTAAALSQTTHPRNTFCPMDGTVS